MTRKEASDMIRDDICLHHNFLSGKYRKALRMAIDVLEKLPDKHGDLIDRDAFRAVYGMNADCADCEKEMRGKVMMCEYDRNYTKMDFCGWLDDAPTIVESEDSE